MNKVNKIVQVNATDWTLLEDTDDNILTLVILGIITSVVV